MRTASRYRSVHTSVATLSLVLVAACGGTSASSSSGAAPGTLADNPNTGGKFIVDAHKNGDGSTLSLSAVRWGRLVDLYDVDPVSGEPSTEPVFRDLLVDPAVESGANLVVRADPVTGKDEVVVLHAVGTPGFAASLDDLENGLQPVMDKGLSATVLPPFTAWPRNAALVLQFDDLLDDGGDPSDPGYPGTVTPDTVGVRRGVSGPSLPSTPASCPTPTTGAVVGGQFHSTRVILDTTVSDLEAIAANLPVNVLGLPEALVADEPNVAVRVPTLVNPSAAQFEVLRNLSGHAVQPTTSGSWDPSSPTLDVVRALRSGSGALGDGSNGFLPDDQAPDLLGVLGVSYSNVVPVGAGRFAMDLDFHSVPCAVAPRPGDVLSVPGSVLRVDVAAGAPASGFVPGVEMTLLHGDSNLSAGVGEFRTPFDPAAGNLPECYVLFSPTATLPPHAGVDPHAAVTLVFNEPMDPASIRAYETFTLTDASQPASPIASRVVGRVQPSSQMDRFAFVPSLPFNHTQGSAETIRIDLAASVTDLAGNPPSPRRCPRRASPSTRPRRPCSREACP